MEPEEVRTTEQPEPEQPPVMTALDVSTLRDLAALPRKETAAQAPSAYEQSKTAYQKARRAEYARQREQQRQQMEEERLQRLEQEEARPPRRSQRRAYAELLEQQGLEEASRAMRRGEISRERALELYGKPPRRFIGLRVLLGVLLVLAVSALLCSLLCFRQPTAELGLGERRGGVSTILLAGTDAGGYRTDSMMLLTVDQNQKTVSLVSIPRDTLIYCEYAVPKLNSAFGYAAGGEEGARQLMRRVTEIVGFLPDGYLIADLETVQALVELFGGVDFDVPLNMFYEDVSQGLHIELPMGMRHLDGEETMQLLRFRSGYTEGDLSRVSVQRSVLFSAMQQWMTPRNLDKIAPAVRLLQSGTLTDLDTEELLWLGRALILSGLQNLQTRTLPGQNTVLADGLYYVLEPQGVAETVNACANPYLYEITPADLSVRIG